MHEAIVFGMIDNGVLVIGMLLGVEFGELLLPRKYRSKAAGAAVGAFLGNAISDGAAGLAISVGFTVGVIIGCLIPIVVMPLVVRRAGGQ
jgi:hypothetical protein